MTPNTETPYHDQKAAAAYLRGSERTLEAWRYRGGGPAYFRCGRKILYKLEDLDAFILAGRRTSTSDPGRAA